MQTKAMEPPLLCLVIWGKVKNCLGKRGEVTSPFHILTQNLSFTFQNGQFLNINFVDKNVAELKVPKELLLRVFLLGCISGRTDCNNPGSMVTDFNMWDRSLGDDELTKWTTCREV